MDDPPAVSFSRKVSPARLSRIPSWIMLGFILGALFIWLLPRSKNEPVTALNSSVPAATPETKPQVAPRKVTNIEAVFSEWGQYAIWEDNRTEVAMWNPETGSYADFYEVLREGEKLYFRSIPTLTRPLLAHASRPDAPLLFTETEEMRRKWIETRSQLVPATPSP